MSYGEIKTKQNNQTDETTFFQQRYNLHNFGELFNPQVGTIFLNGTYLNQNTETERRASDQDFSFNDYSINLNLLPYISPLGLYYQRVNRSNKIDQTTNQPALKIRDRLTTVGGNWSLSAPRIPRLSVSYNQSELESTDDSNRFPNTINRFLNLESSGQIGETTLIGRYQFNEAEVARLGTTGAVETIRGNAVNLTTESRLAPAMIFSTFSRISTRGGSSGPGLSFAQERGFGASLFYTPSVKWDTHARLNISETPAGSSGGVDLKQQNFFWSGSYRPTEELDMVMSARYFRFDIANVETTSPFFDYSVNYRPFFGFSTGFGASYGETETKGGGTEVTNNFQRYRGNIDYTRAIEFLRYSTGYSVSYGASDTKSKNKGEAKDLMNTLSLSVENTRIRFVHVALSYIFNDVDRSHTGPAVQDAEDQTSHRYQINADSSYFRRILREDDSLLLQSTASWTDIDGFGIDGTTFLLDGRGSYFFLRGALLSTGYTHQDYPGGFFLDSDIFFEEIRWNFFIGRTSFTLGARANQERTDGTSSLDRDTIETTAEISYRIGKFVLSADGRWGKDTSESESEDVDFESQSFFVRASRSF